MEKLLKLTADILFQIDELNNGQPFAYKTFLTKLQEVENELKRTLYCSGSTENAAKILESFNKILANITDFCKASISSLIGSNPSYLKSTDSFNERFAVFDTLPYDVNYADEYAELAKISKFKAIPVITALEDLQKSSLPNCHILEFLNKYEKFYLTEPFKSLFGYDVEYIVTFFESNSPEKISLISVTDEIYKSKYFTDEMITKYDTAFNGYFQHLPNDKNINAANFYNNLQLKEKDFYKLKPKTYNALTCIEHCANNAMENNLVKPDKRVEFTSVFKVKKQYGPVRYYRDYLKFALNAHKYDDAADIGKHLKITVDYSSKNIIPEKSSWNIIKNKKIETQLSEQVVKKSALRSVLGKIFLGPAATTADYAQIGVWTVTGLLMGAHFISQKIGLSNPDPKEFSTEFYTQRIEHLEKEIFMSNLVESSHAESFYVSEKNQTIISNKEIHEAALELAQLNKKTVELFGESIDSVRVAYETRNASSSKISSLTSQLYLVNEYEKLKKMTTLSSELELYYNYNNKNSEDIIKEIKIENKKIIDTQIVINNYSKALKYIAKAELDQNINDLQQLVKISTNTNLVDPSGSQPKTLIENF